MEVWTVGRTDKPIDGRIGVHTLNELQCQLICVSDSTLVRLCESENEQNVDLPFACQVLRASRFHVLG